MEVDLNEIDHNLELPRDRKLRASSIDIVEGDPTPEDDVAIAEAVAQIEEELNSADVKRTTSNDLYTTRMEVDLKEIDHTLELPRGNKQRASSIDIVPGDPTPEDDVAIAEAVAQIEEELTKTEKPSSSGLLVAVGVAGAAMLLARFLFRV